MSLHALTASILLAIAQSAPVDTAAPASLPTSEVRASFRKLLDRTRVAPDVLQDGVKTEDGLTTERLSIASEKKADGSIERVPMLLVRPEGDGPEGPRPRPLVIVLHGTGGTKEGMKGWLVDLAKRGIIGVAIDGRYHGERAGGASKTKNAAYNDAIVRAWRAKPGESQEHPFYYDTCWDLWVTVDYLAARRDVDPRRIGMLGTSKGGIETWLAAAVDDRVAVAVPAIAVQSFRWGLEHDRWQGRARTIAAAHQAAAADLGASEVNAEVCRALWDKVVPGILGPYDAPSMLRLFAGRPLLILNGELDPNCPLEGAELAFEAARDAYKQANASEKLAIDVAQGVGHSVTPEQRRKALDWLVRWLKP